MEGAMRESTDRVIFFQRLAQAPYKFDFYQALRRVECFYAELPRLGKGMRPVDEPIRLAQEPSMTFAPATLSAFAPPTADRPARLEVRFFGLLGPNGPLPLHLTEHARERMFHANDPTFVRFLDILHHRFLLLFYRAWAQAQPTVSLDRPREDRFATYIGSLIGQAGVKVRGRDAIDDSAKLYFAGLLSRQTRNRDGLAALLTGYFRVPSVIEEFSGHWMHLPVGERTRLGSMSEGAQVGIGAVLGARVWDRQHKIRLRLGPMPLVLYERFLPGGLAAARLVHWLKQYLGLDLEWDARLVLKRNEVPQLRPGRYGRLGWTTWLGTKAHEKDADKLILGVARLAGVSKAAMPR
jgi:type VI secretion system protein ImpH